MTRITNCHVTNQLTNLMSGLMVLWPLDVQIMNNLRLGICMTTLVVSVQLLTGIAKTEMMKPNQRKDDKSFASPLHEEWQCTYMYMYARRTYMKKQRCKLLLDYQFDTCCVLLITTYVHSTS